MDPNAALLDLIEAATRQSSSPEVSRHLAEQVEACAADLAQWIRRGGYAPSDPRTPPLSAIEQAEIAASNADRE